jgi:hypothetical protein
MDGHKLLMISLSLSLSLSLTLSLTVSFFAARRKLIDSSLSSESPLPDLLPTHLKPMCWLNLLEQTIAGIENIVNFGLQWRQRSRTVFLYVSGVGGS